MYRFLVFENGKPAASCPLRNAYLLGADGTALRADIQFADSEIQIVKRDPGTASLVMQRAIGECGELSIQTCLLPERDQPYLLTLELARHRLMTLYNKLEDWAMFDINADHPVARRTELARRLFIEALCYQHDDPIKAEKLAGDALIAALDGSEELALAHADLLLTRRRATRLLPKHPIGCGVRLDQTHERLRAGLQSNFDFLCLPTPWRKLAPEEGDYNWAEMDSWAEWAGRNRVNLIAGPIVSFRPSSLPNWFYIWEHDYETIRDLIYEHVERVVRRYRNSVTAWNVISGLHLNNHLTFTFDQLMDLTRMTTMLVKKIQPAARALIEIEQPFGEYFSTNQRSIPPLTYADLVVQGAINFDGFSLKLLMGQASPGQFTRDLMQISHLLDQFAYFGKPVTLQIGVPSDRIGEDKLERVDKNVPVDPESGYWRRAWSPIVQSHWLEAVMQIAMSKPFIEAVAWSELQDHPESELPNSGLLSDDLQPKAAFKRLVTFRSHLLGLNGGNAGTQPAARTPRTELLDNDNENVSSGSNI